VLEVRGFRFVSRENGKGSGGYFASVEFAKGDRTLRLWLRRSSLGVRYEIAGHGLNHEEYMRELLAPGGGNRFPSYSADTMVAFAALRADLQQFALDFLDGPGDEFMRCWTVVDADRLLSGPQRLARIERRLPGRVSDAWREFDLAVSRWRLGELMAERLPEAVLGALSAGCESTSLPQLAAMEGARWSEVEPLVARVLGERAMSVPSEADALKRVADDVVERMLAGDVDPADAARRLRHLSMRAINDPAWDDLGVFHHLALDWEVAEDAGLDLDHLRAEMLREGQELMARGGVRAERVGRDATC
jgi:hypothetical protein